MGSDATFKVGDEVEWTSQAGGTTRTKRGTVVEVVPARRDPVTKLRETGFARDHESYVVRAIALGRQSGERKATYWPRASSLRAPAMPANRKAAPARNPMLQAADALDKFKESDLDCGCTHASQAAAFLCAVRKFLLRQAAAEEARHA